MQLDLACHATSYGSGPFHPAIAKNIGLNRFDIYYWPNITFQTEQEAYDRASESLRDVYAAANDVCKDWNVYKV